MLSAISFGVLRRSAPSTSAIMRSRNDLPGSCVTSITSRSERSFVPPVTAERSPPDSRMTGADSPVIADSSTEPTPSMISPSAGMIIARLDDHDVALLQLGRRHLEAAVARAALSVVVRVARSAFACALPRPSAIASAKFAKSTVSQSQTAITPTNQSWPSCPRARSRKKITVVMTLPSSTMNITGFFSCSRGSSFGNESPDRRERELAREDARALGRGHHYFPPSLSSARLSSSTLTPGSPKKPSERPSVFCLISFCTVASGRWRTAATRCACSAA